MARNSRYFSLAPVTLCLGISLFASRANGATVKLTDLVKSIPGGTNKSVEIKAGVRAVIDGSVDVGQLVINGELVCSSASAKIRATQIYVNGLFQCGSETAKFNKRLYIELKHSSANPRTSSAYRGFIVNNGGKLKLYGNGDKSGISKLTKTANNGDTTIQINRNVSGKWAAGDVIAIAPSSYNYLEYEKFVVKSVSAAGNVITLDKALKYRHYGVLDSYATKKMGTLSIDQRAEVVNLTRRITVQSDETSFKIPDTDIPDGELGAHTMVNRGGFAQIDGVEFHRMGQAGVMARYPFHWHFAGNVSGQYIKNSSIHDSFQRCITVHQTNSAVVSGNSCVNFKGHGYFLEDGNEVNNTISGNIGIGAKRPYQSKLLLASDNGNAAASGVTARRFPAVSVFWISNPQNTVVNNIAAGSVGVGFWMAFIDTVRRFNSKTNEYDGEVLARPRTTNTTKFDNNVAHSTLVGHTWDGGPDHRLNSSTGNMNNPNNPGDRRVEIVHYAPTTTPTFNGLVAYKNLQAGIYFRGNTVVFNNLRMADNGWALFLAYNQIVKNSLVVAQSNNHFPSDEYYLYDQKNGRMKERRVGIVLYDGPWELTNVEFAKFSTSKVVKTFLKNNVPYQKDVTAVALKTIGGSEKFVNRSRQLAFTPEPYHRLVLEYEGLPVSGWVDIDDSNSVRDLDGSLSGSANAIILPKSNFYMHSGCNEKKIGGRPTLDGFMVCPSTTKVGQFWFASSNTLNKVPFVMKRNGNNSTTLPKASWNLLKDVGDLSRANIFNRKANVLLNPADSYEALVDTKLLSSSQGYNKLRVSFYSEAGPSFSPVLRIYGVGANCRLEGASSLSSLNALKSASGDGYYSSGNSLYIRMRSVSRFKNIKTGSGSANDHVSVSRVINCANETETGIKGYIGTNTVNGDFYINGWACDYDMAPTTNVHVYLGGAAGKGGTMVGAAAANRNSEDAVNLACGNLTQTGYRFSYKVSSDVMKKFKGKPIYVHGISLSKKANITLGNSGKYSIP